ncbi:WhiB family transcriptional regulator [Mycobacterium heckeshornense]|uniref:WhiB family transcriptional regulator n=1 Tax=Mycobacterium heckeshornense TaxID=110505 RepID=UPI0006627A84|nr:WhiB family transcriptional regulator [Mycobacterium heckeshornense]
MAYTLTGPPAEDGLCRYGDPTDWFGRHAVHRARAIAICNNCPIQRQCALDALKDDNTDGVWAGVFLPGLRDAAGLALARAKLVEVAQRLEHASEAHRRRAENIRAALRFAAHRAQGRSSA